jgi:methylisocitrate lyase
MMGQRLRELLDSTPVVYAPGAWDGLSALLIERAGFPAIGASGFAISARYGLPDAQLYTMTENLNAVREMVAAVNIPVIADIDTGYGNAVNVFRTVREFERAGAAAMHIEDQASPKRCPMCVGDPVEVVGKKEALGRIAAALDARTDDSVMIIARCDATGADAMDRIVAYADAGADMIMPVSRTFKNVAEVKACHEACGKPLMLSLSPTSWVEREFTRQRLIECGVSIASMPLQALYAATTAVQNTLSRLMETECPSAVTRENIAHDDFADLIGFGEVRRIENDYVPSRA